MARKNNVCPLLTAVITTGASNGHELWGTQAAFQASGLVSTSTGSATILIQGSNTNSDLYYMTIATISLTLGTTLTADGFAMNAPWKYVRAKVSAISGTDATVTVTVANQGI